MNTLPCFSTPCRCWKPTRFPYTEGWQRKGTPSPHTIPSRSHSNAKWSLAKCQSSNPEKHTKQSFVRDLYRNHVLVMVDWPRSDVLARPGFDVDLCFLCLFDSPGDTNWFEVIGSNLGEVQLEIRGVLANCCLKSSLQALELHHLRLNFGTCEQCEKPVSYQYGSVE